VAFHTQGAADKVLIALTVVAREVVVQPGGQGQQAAAEVEWLNPAVADAVEAPLEIDHATRVRRVALHRDGNGLVLNYSPCAAVQRALPGSGSKTAFVVERQLAVINSLARIELQSAWCR